MENGFAYFRRESGVMPYSGFAENPLVSPKVLIIGDFSRKSPFFLFLGFLAYVFFF
jgi:hypothetical protein